MTSLLHDLRFAFRLLRKAPSFTAVVVFTLALGIGGNTAIFSVIRAVLLKPLPFREPDKIVMLWEANPELGEEQLQIAGAGYLAWNEQNQVFTSMGFIWNFSHKARKFNLVLDNETEYLQGRYVSASFFDVLDVKPLLGRTFLPEEDRFQRDQVIVLSHALWQRRFNADEGILGRSIQLDNYDTQRSFTVVGVMPDGFVFPADCQFWLPAGCMDRELDWYRNSRRGRHFHVIARLKPEVTIEQARSEINLIAARVRQEYPDAMVATDVRVVPLLEQLVGDLSGSLVLVWGAVLSVLLITCANVANLLLARAGTREKEIAIRMALGATRGRVVRQLLTESVLLALLGGALGLVLAYAGGYALLAISPHETANVKDIKMDRVETAAIDPTVLGFTILISLLTGVIFGLAPAIHTSKPNLEESLKEGGRGSSSGRHRQRLRSVLIVGQIALAFILLIGAMLMIRSFARLLSVDPGFEPANVTAGLIDWVSPNYAKDDRRVAMAEQILERLATLPGVTSAAGVGELPLEGIGWTVPLAFEGVSPSTSSEDLSADVLAVTPNYFDTLRIPFLKGRDFTQLDTAGHPSVAIINATMAERFWPNDNPLGKRLAFHSPGQWIEIVGVVQDVKHSGLREGVRPTIHLPYAQSPVPILNFVLRTEADPRAIEIPFRHQVLELTKEQPLVTVRTMNEVLSDSVSQIRFRAILLALFAAIALLLAALGIYGVISYSVVQRTREIGIRLALGAQPAQVLRMMIGGGLKLALVGVILGLIGALALAQFVQSQLYGIVATDLWTYVSVAVVLLLTALAACWIPSYRATRIDPMIALRHE